MTETSQPTQTDEKRPRLLGRTLASRWMALAAPCLGVWLALPALDVPLQIDDLFHRAVMNGSEQYGEYLPGPQGMFRFVSGDEEKAHALMDLGFLPWWTYKGVKAEFLQFLTVQTHILDYWLWPESPWMMHAHSLAWFAALVCLAAVFYRRILGPTWMAGLAALLFAVEDAHAMPVAWVCNRNVLLAATFGVGCLIAHDSWRRTGRQRYFWLAAILWTGSLLSKEAGIATCAYLFAYAMCLDSARLGRRVLTLVPYGLILVLWRVLRDAAGYGAEEMGFYVDPISDPGRFLASLGERAPMFLMGQWGLPPSEVSIFFPRLVGSPVWWWAVALVSILGLLFWPLLRRDAVARFFALGMLLAVIPICATFPTNRLLMFVGLGAMGLLVRFWCFVFTRDGDRPQTMAWRVPAVAIAVLLGLIHLVLAPLLFHVRTGRPLGPEWIGDSLLVQTTFDESITGQDLILLNPPSAMHAAYYPMICEHEGRPLPRAMRCLGPGTCVIEVRRLDERTLAITAARDFMCFFLDPLFRNEDHPMHVGQRVELRGLEIEVTAVTPLGRPKAAVFRFDRPLEDASLRWIYWERGHFRPFPLPAVGETITIDPGWLTVKDLLGGGPPDDWVGP